MKIITISREFGSGGRELGKRMADILGFDYYDREIISAIAEKQGLSENYVENTLNNHGWQTVPLTYRRTFAGSAAMQSVQVNLLLEQKKVIEEIAKAGKDCVIVGRNADIILENENLFRMFVCADMETKIDRCMDRAQGDEQLTRKEVERHIKRIDKNRARTREMLSDRGWGQKDAYEMILNTTEWNIKELAPAAAGFAESWFRRK